MPEVCLVIPCFNEASRLQGREILALLTRDPQVSVFMAMDADQADVSAVERRLRTHPEVGRVDFII